MYSMLEMGDPTINLLLNSPKCTLSKDIIEEIKAFLSDPHMVVKVKNVDEMCYEDFFCVVYSYDKSSADDYGLLPHDNSTKTDHSYIRTSQVILNEEDHMLTTNKPHKVYDEMVNSANSLTSLSQLEEPRNLKQVQSMQYILKKKLKDVSR